MCVARILTTRSYLVGIPLEFLENSTISRPSMAVQWPSKRAEGWKQTDRRRLHSPPLFAAALVAPVPAAPSAFFWSERATPLAVGAAYQWCRLA